MVNLSQIHLRKMQAVGQGTGRSAAVDVWLDNGKLKIPAGTTVWVMTHALQNTSHIWEDHDQFIPERWEEPGIENARPREDDSKGADNGTAKRWMPFLEGRSAHSPPGKSLTMSKRVVGCKQARLGLDAIEKCLRNGRRHAAAACFVCTHSAV